MAVRIAVGDVVLVTQTPLGSGRARRGVLVIPDRPRAIDRYIDYFGGGVGRSRAPWLGQPQIGATSALSGLHTIAERLLSVREAVRGADGRGRSGPAGRTPGRRSHISKRSGRPGDRRAGAVVGAAWPFGGEVGALGARDVAAPVGPKVLPAGAGPS